MEPFQTARLTVRELCLDDAADVLALLGSDNFIQNIGDKGVRTLDDARQYLTDGPLASYLAQGFGLWRVATRVDDHFIGVCGLIRRPELPAVDIGYALMPGCDGKGYGIEAATACLEKRHALGIEKVIAIVSETNLPSRRLLEKLGLGYSRHIAFGEDAKPLMLYEMVSN